MDLISNVQTFTQEMITGYDSRVTKIEEILTSAYDALDDCRERRMQVNDQLQQTLASKYSLRRKDFDMIVHDLHESQVECESNIKESVRLFTKGYQYLSAQFFQSLITGEIEQSQEAVKKIETDGREIQDTIKTFQQEQMEIADDLRSLLRESESIRIKDFKKMIENIRLRQCRRNEQIRAFLNKISEEHNRMRTIWKEISADKAKLRQCRVDSHEGGS